MSDEQSIAVPAIDKLEEGAPPPIVKSVAWLVLVLGPLLAIWDVSAMRTAIVAYSRKMPDELEIYYFINVSVYLDMGLLFFIAGLALILNRTWGRAVGYAAAILCFISWFAAYVLGGVMKRLVEEGEIRLQPKPLFFHFDLPGSVSYVGPLFGVVLLIFLSLPAFGRWVRSRAPVPSRPNAKLSGTAIGSFICSLIPILGVTQLVGLALGASALAQIKKSNGLLRGKALAAAGITISLWVMVLIVAFAVATFPGRP
jgi:hypothetical protein